MISMIAPHITRTIEHKMLSYIDMRFRRENSSVTPNPIEGRTSNGPLSLTCVDRNRDSLDFPL